MRSLCALALFGVVGLASVVGCAPVPGGQALTNTTAAGGAVSSVTTIEPGQVAPELTAEPVQVFPQVTAAAE